MTPYEIIRRPRLTEKSVFLQNAQNTYTFEVHTKANKVTIKEAVERLFKVKVRKVNTQNCAGKLRRVGQSLGRTGDWKKALVTLADGETIEGI